MNIPDDFESLQETLDRVIAERNAASVERDKAHLELEEARANIELLEKNNVNLGHAYNQLRDQVERMQVTPDDADKLRVALQTEVHRLTDEVAKYRDYDKGTAMSRVRELEGALRTTIVMFSGNLEKLQGKLEYTEGRLQEWEQGKRYRTRHPTYRCETHGSDVEPTAWVCSEGCMVHPSAIHSHDVGRNAEVCNGVSG